MSGALPLLAGIGCPIVFGASRKRFIGTLSGVETPGDRVAGSVAAALHAATQGASILRVHDVAETVQALAVWNAVAAGGVVLRAATAAGLATLITPTRFTAHHDFAAALRVVPDLGQVNLAMLRQWHGEPARTGRA